MQCFFINLEVENKKSSLIKNRFDAINTCGWDLKRFPALDKEYVIKNDVTGCISDGAKGCFLSHREVINKNLGNDQHLWIMEDDVVFSGKVQQYILSSIEQLPDDWDMLYTDVCIPDPKTMIDCFNAKRNLNGYAVGTTNLKELNFCSTASYLINKKSTGLIFEILNSQKELNIPIDILYRELVHHGSIQAYSIFPFVTTLSDLAAISNIQTSDFSFTETVWRAFRRYIWVDANLEDISLDLATLSKANFAPVDGAFVKILAAFYAKEFKEK